MTLAQSRVFCVELSFLTLGMAAWCRSSFLPEHPLSVVRVLADSVPPSVPLSVLVYVEGTRKPFWQVFLPPGIIRNIPEATVTLHITV